LPNKQPKKDFFDEARTKLRDLWQRVSQHIETGNPSFKIDDENVQSKIEQVLLSSTKTYHYVLPTQILAKMVDPSLDSRVVQKKHAGAGAFDARSLSKEVIVPFDRENYNILGGAPEPYVNKPLRLEVISADKTVDQKNKKDWEALVDALTWVQENPKQIETAYLAVLSIIYSRLKFQKITYSVPNRISLKQTLELIDKFLADVSGGDRFAALATSLFTVIGQYFCIFDKVKRGHINAPDAQSGQVMDLDCIRDDQLVMSVELKDRELILTDIQEKLPSIRERRVAESFFISRKVPADLSELGEFTQRQYQMGHNIYIFTLVDFAASILALIGEKGRIKFLAQVGSTLDQYSELVHRKTWEKLLLAI
jgi:hypothetical protein